MIDDIDNGQWISMTTENEEDIHISNTHKYFVYDKKPSAGGGVENSFYLRDKNDTDPAADELVQQAVGYYSYTDTLLWHYGRAKPGSAVELKPMYRMADNIEVEKSLVDDTNHNGVGETGEDLTYQLDIKTIHRSLQVM